MDEPEDHTRHSAKPHVSIQKIPEGSFPIRIPQTRDKKRAVLSCKLTENTNPSSRSRLAGIPRPKSGQSYTELKKHHDELVSHIQTLKSESLENKRKQDTHLQRLCGEIEQYKANTLALQKEISSYQAALGNRSKTIQVLQNQLESVKLENKRLVAILENAKLDVLSGDSIKPTAHEDLQVQVQLSAHETKADCYVSRLHDIVTHLQEQRSSIQNSVT